jgi:hypothetical protein
MLGSYRQDERNDLRLQNIFSDARAKAQRDLHYLITAHQLNKEAAIIAQSGAINVVKRFDMPHLADASAVFREIDCLIFLHIETNNQGIPFLTMSWGKHRHVENTPSTDKYCAYRFGMFGIEDDIKDSRCRGVRDIYAYKSSTKEVAEVQNSIIEPSMTF